MPKTIGPMSFTHEALSNQKTHFYTLATDDENTKIVVRTHKDLVSVKIEKGESARFADSKGLLGDFTYGTTTGRNGTVIEDPILYSMDWQGKICDRLPALTASLLTHLIFVTNVLCTSA